MILKHRILRSDQNLLRLDNVDMEEEVEETEEASQKKEYIFKPALLCMSGFRDLSICKNQLGPWLLGFKLI